MRRAFLVCGSESSGNRMLAACLIRAGCGGSASTAQALDYSSIAGDPIVIIRHHHIGWEFRELRLAGFDVTALIVVREQMAQRASLVKMGFVENVEAADERIVTTLASTLADCLLYNINFRIVTFESINDEFLKVFLSALSLRSDNLDQPLLLDGQIWHPEQPSPLEANRRRYQCLS